MWEGLSTSPTCGGTERLVAEVFWAFITSQWEVGLVPRVGSLLTQIRGCKDLGQLLCWVLEWGEAGNTCFLLSVFCHHLYFMACACVIQKLDRSFKQTLKRVWPG